MRPESKSNFKIQAIQKEQVQLVKIENILTKLLGKVNESVNELKVEELQIKSNLIEHFTTNCQDDQPTTSAQAATRSLIYKGDLENATIDIEGIEDINKQILALESLLVPLKQKNYNEEEEDENDDADDDEYLSTYRK